MTVLMRVLVLLLLTAVVCIRALSPRQKGLVKVFKTDTKSRLLAVRPSSFSLTSVTDPLGDVAPSFAHTSKGKTLVMPAVEQGRPSAQASGSSEIAGLKPNYEVNRPTRILPNNVKACTVTLATNAFANSYGQPVVTTYTPDILDSSCKDPSKWVFIELTLSGNVFGRQFDRLGSVQLDGVEVLRTDNPEPTRTGVQWTFSKEMNRYYDLWRTKRSLVFDFPNIVNDVYTGILNTTLSFTAYIPASSACKLQPLALDYPRILALSKKNFQENSFFNYGDNGGDNGSTAVKFPINAKAALVEIYASGTAQDEFWYTNVPNQFYEQIRSSPMASQLGLLPRGPLREIQVLVNSQLAGVVQPFPVIFTGGISPYFWRPQVAYGAYDQPTYYVDISPFLGQLTDDAEHNIQLKVVSAEKNQTVLSWFISGNVQVQLDSSEKRTTGSITKYHAPAAGDMTTTGMVGPDFNSSGTLHYEVEGPRTISITASIQPGSSAVPYQVSWEQNFYFSNSNRYTSQTSDTDQHASGQSSSMHGSRKFFTSNFTFPLHLSSVGYNYTLDHSFDQSIDFSLPHTFKEPASQHVSMSQKGKASMLFNDQGQLVSGTGASEEQYNYQDSDGFTYQQSNIASNGSVTSNFVEGTLKRKAVQVY